MAESQLTDIVRRIITSLQNLPEGTEDSAETRASTQPANLPNGINSSADNNSGSKNFTRGSKSLERIQLQLQHRQGIQQEMEAGVLCPTRL